LSPINALSRDIGQRGSATLEAGLLGVAIIFLMLSAFEGSIIMWQYHTMAEAVQVSARYAAAHGLGCTQNGNTCSITVGQIASYIQSTGVGLDPAKLNVTLVSTNSTVTCSPLNTCTSNGTVFPPSGDNSPGADVKVTATYLMSNPLVMFSPGAGASKIGKVTLGATSTQRILF
jgi:Flp pilus assembly protein TadG